MPSGPDGSPEARSGEASGCSNTVRRRLVIRATRVDYTTHVRWCARVTHRGICAAHQARSPEDTSLSIFSTSLCSGDPATRCCRENTKNILDIYEHVHCLNRIHPSYSSKIQDLIMFIQDILSSSTTNVLARDLTLTVSPPWGVRGAGQGSSIHGGRSVSARTSGILSSMPDEARRAGVRGVPGSQEPSRHAAARGSGQMVFEGGAAAECLDFLRRHRGDCDSSSRRDDPAENACERVFAGVVPAGGARAAVRVRRGPDLPGRRLRRRPCFFDGPVPCLQVVPTRDNRVGPLARPSLARSRLCSGRIRRRRASSASAHPPLRC